MLGSSTNRPPCAKCWVNNGRRVPSALLGSDIGNQPVTQTWFGGVTVNSRCNRFGARQSPRRASPVVWCLKIERTILTGVGRISFLIGDYADGPPWTPATKLQITDAERAELHARLRVRKAPEDGSCACESCWAAQMRVGHHDCPTLGHDGANCLQVAAALPGVSSGGFDRCPARWPPAQCGRRAGSAHCGQGSPEQA